MLAGALRLSGNPARINVPRRMSGSLSFAGAFLSGRIKRLTGSLNLISGARRSFLRRLEGILGLVGLFPRERKLTFNRVLRFNGALKNISSKNMIVQVFRLLGSWRTRFYLDGEIDE